MASDVKKMMKMKNLVSLIFIWFYSSILSTYLGLLGGLETNLLYLTYGLGLYEDTGFSSFIWYFLAIKASCLISCFNLALRILSSFNAWSFKCLAVGVKLLPILSEGLLCKNWLWWGTPRVLPWSVNSDGCFPKSFKIFRYCALVREILSF